MSANARLADVSAPWCCDCADWHQPGDHAILDAKTGRVWCNECANWHLRGHHLYGLRPATVP